MQSNAIPFQQEIIVTVTRKGQITIPTEARRYLNTDKQRKLALVMEPGGTVRLKQSTYPTLESLAGVVPPLKKPMTMQEMRDVIADERAEAYLAKNR